MVRTKQLVLNLVHKIFRINTAIFRRDKQEESLMQDLVLNLSHKIKKVLWHLEVNNMYTNTFSSKIIRLLKWLKHTPLPIMLKNTKTGKMISITLQVWTQIINSVLREVILKILTIISSVRELGKVHMLWLE